MTEQHQELTAPRVETERPLEPRIYVASLSDYNDGRLHGRWLDANQPIDDLQAGIAEMLAASPVPWAEEYAIHDYDDFGGLRLDEYESLDTIAAMAAGIVKYGRPFAAWARSVGTKQATPESFRGQYLGSWADLRAFGEEFVDDLGLERYLDAVPKSLRPYVSVNTDALVSDMLLNGEIDTFEDGVGVVHVFLALGSST